MASPQLLSYSLTTSAELGWWSGRWTGAYADASEALDWAQEQGQPGLMAYSLSMLLRLDAARGDRQTWQRHDAMLSGRLTVAVPHVRIHAAIARGHLALARGEASGALAALRQAQDIAVHGHLGNPNVVPWAGDLAEAPWPWVAMRRPWRLRPGWMSGPTLPACATQP